MFLAIDFCKFKRSNNLFVVANNYAESDILDGLRHGKPQTIKYLYQHAFPQCASLITKNSGSVEDARDIFQDALVVLFKKIRESDFKLTANIKTYLYAIVRNLWLKELEKTRKDPGVTILDDPDMHVVAIATDEIAEKQEVEKKHQWLSRKLDELKEDCKRILIDFYFKRIALTDIGDQMGYTSQFIRVKKNRCMEAMRKKANDYHE